MEDVYFMGSIAGHKVVVACLPGRTGTNSAAAVATRTQAKSKEIRFGLIVGTEGGVPSEHTDNRLGDVVQYDVGKTTPTEVIQTGSLDSPPQVLISAAISLESDILLGEETLLTRLSKISHIRRFQRRKPGPEILHKADCDHESGKRARIIALTGRWYGLSTKKQERWRYIMGPSPQAINS